MYENKVKAILGSRVKQRRETLELTESELATKIGISENQLFDIERGEKSPSFDNFISLCNILNCNADYLLSGNPREPVDEKFLQIINSLTIEDQNILWKLLNCYIHQINKSF